MAKTLHEWLQTDVARVRAKPMRWLSERYFFRDPSRAVYSDADREEWFDRLEAFYEEVGVPIEAKER